MKIPKRYENKVASFQRLNEDDYNTACYCVNLKNGYLYDGEGLHYTETYKEAIEIMKEAARLED